MIVTGGLGFIGSNFINYWMSQYPEDHIVNVDKMTYASDPANISDPNNGNYQFVKADILDKERIGKLVRDSDAIINFAAESHVDNSISSPEQFLQSNYMGVFNLLEYVRKYDLRFHQVSTDEVYGSLPLNSSGSFDEHSPYNPRNPYSATKAAADFLVRSYVNTYGIKATISNCSNNFGPNQHPEKLIPKTILNAIEGKKIPVYGNGLQIRDWIFVEDHCTALDLVLKKGKVGETYLVSSRKEKRNIDVVKEILGILGLQEELIVYVEDRPGHDVRYSINPKKIEEKLGWKPKHKFSDALKSTVEHYLKNSLKYKK
jgi:dTDP-glucose 4,6-dehydratase